VAIGLLTSWQEGFMRRYFQIVLLGVGLMAPLALSAGDHPKRYYDREHRDYHEWNDGEQQSYQRFLSEKRYEHHDWQRARKQEQRDYWQWRHQHPD
jgi:hypothetical protein